MRLLNIDSLRLETFYDDDIPPYAILSHRWGKQKTTYTKMQTGKSLSSPGDHTSQELQYVWADTCCIDRRDAAELSESTNSMFEYYSECVECYVYLNILPAAGYNPVEVSIGNAALHRLPIDSTWFSRGWTLQELLAPRTILFFDGHWNLIGHKCWNECPCAAVNNNSRYGINLNGSISSITGIAVEYLTGEKDIADASIACKMSWACFRRTKRNEDEAYCLQGLFDIKMPTLYGEGRRRAFLRLQRELLRQSTDQSIFAWTAPPEPRGWAKTYIYARSLLASSPVSFIGSGDVQTGAGEGISYSMRNKGIKLRAWSQQVSFRQGSRSMAFFIIQLNCTRPGQNGFRLPVEVAITDGTSQEEPEPHSVYRRVMASDLGHAIDKRFDPTMRPPPLERTFYMEASADDIFPFPKL